MKRLPHYKLAERIARADYEHLHKLSWEDLPARARVLRVEIAIETIRSLARAGLKLVEKSASR